ncbi:MAG: response regulator [Eubacteriales bacterium]
MSAKSLIYAVDDEQSIRELYSCALESADFAVSCFSDADGLFAALRDRIPDIILLDIMLDGRDGYQILAALRRDVRYAAVPVIMVSAKGSELDKVKGLNLGADDYLSKPFGVLELVARIRANLRRLTPSADTEKFEYKGITVDDARHELRINGKPVRTTAKEYALLRVLVQNSGTVLSRDRLLDTVWGENYGETRTLDLHIAQIRRLIPDSGAGITTVRGVGYMLE